MYCSSCGFEQTQELTYCKRCGANLKPLNPSSSSPTMIGPTFVLAMATVLVTLGGFAMIFGTVVTLLNRGVGLSPGGMFLVAFSLLVVLLIAGLLLRQLSRVIDFSVLNRGAGTTERQNLRSQPVPEISAGREPVASVTDHTTRTLQPANSDRQTPQ